MVEGVIDFIKVFFEKIWFWLIIATTSVSALFSQRLFLWLGFYDSKRWLVGFVAIVSLSLSVQYVCECLKDILHHEKIIKNIDNLPAESISVLKHIVRENKKTLKIMEKDGLHQHRLIAHFELERLGNYVTFPDYLWKELVKRFRD